ncbi:signal peptidase II [Blastococcus sp. Marseille-P5729]|uniref:signal peptidase II n=1 Tax=Blastococcus sp. Marseille-P5729 TaxID=2086582 RepID=UPI001F384653|nr:signal peptidase II [Blastococcus sp. Marseille-P5729]
MPSSAETDASPAVTYRRTILLLSIAAVILVVDLATKLWAVESLTGREPLRLAGGALYLTLARNTGAAFSLGTDFTVIITIIMLTVIAGILFISRKVRSTPWAWALGLILGGAAGNLIDRLFRHPGPFRGAVIDFFSVLDPYGQFFPIFNVADICIVCGGILAGLLAVLGLDIDGTRAKDAEAEAAGS